MEGTPTAASGDAGTEPAVVVVHTAAEEAALAASRLEDASPADIAAAASAAAVAAITEVSAAHEKLIAGRASPTVPAALPAEDAGVAAVLQLLVASQQQTQALLAST